ncbi:MAG: prepilin-type N-terminal cleavage/methylation domain-containing protein [Burkholderiaceae bacterium]
MNHFHPSQQGFTLLEVLIALALMALLSLLSWRALDITARSQDHLNAYTDDTLALMRVLGQIESDLSRHADSGVLALSAPSPAVSDKAPAAAVGPVLPPGIRWVAPRLTVLRSAHNGAWQEVIWSHEGGTLRRAAGPASHVLPLPAAQASEIMLSDIQTFTVRAWLPDLGWADTTQPGAQLAATGLEIAIERRHNGVDEIYRKVVLLP